MFAGTTKKTESDPWKMPTESPKESDRIKQILSDEQSHIEMLRQFQNELRAMQLDAVSEGESLSAATQSAANAESYMLEDEGGSFERKLTEESKVLRTQLEASENKLQNAEKSVRALQDKVKLLERAKAASAKEGESRVSCLKQQLDDLVSSAECMRQEEEDKRHTLEKQVVMLEAERIDAEVLALKIQNAVPEEEYYALQRQVNEAELEKAAAVRKQMSAEERMQSLSHERALLQRHCAQVADTAKHIEVEKDMEMARTVAYFEDQLADAKIKMTQLQQKLDHTVNELHVSEAQLEKETTVAAQRQQDHENKIAELHSLLKTFQSTAKEMRTESEREHHLEAMIGEFLHQMACQHHHASVSEQELRVLQSGSCDENLPRSVEEDSQRKGSSLTADNVSIPSSAGEAYRKKPATQLHEALLTASSQVQVDCQQSGPPGIQPAVAPRGRKYFVPQTDGKSLVAKEPARSL